MSISLRDARSVWHPYTRHFDSPKFPVITEAKGSFLHLDNGEKILDAISSWWVNLHGHSHPYLLAKLQEAAQEMQQVMFAGFTHPRAVELAEKIISLYGRGQAKAFYSDNGSTSVEVALKMGFQYWLNLGKRKNKMIAFHGSYHGDTFGAMAVSSRSVFSEPFWPFLFEVEFISSPVKGQNNVLMELDKIYALHGDEIAGVIFEPMVQGAGGMIIHDPELLNTVLAYVKERDGLIIADEVLTGFGRTGKLFGTHHFQVSPDIVCLSKGLTGGMLPLGLTLATDEVFNAFNSSNLNKALLHGHSFTGNVLSIAVAIASLELLLTDETQEKIQLISEGHGKFIAQSSHPLFKNVRKLGTILAMEIGNTNGNYSSLLKESLHEYFLKRAILLRPLGNTLYVLPPYSIKEDELKKIYDSILNLPQEFKL